MILLAQLLLAAEVQVQTLKVTREQAGRPLLVQVGAGRVSRLVFPEASTGSKYSAGAKEALGLRIVQSRPAATFLIHPGSAPAKGTLLFSGPTISATVLIEAVENRAPVEVRFVLVDEETTALRSSTTAGKQGRAEASGRVGDSAPRAQKAPPVEEGTPSLLPPPPSSTVVPPTSPSAGSGTPTNDADLRVAGPATSAPPTATPPPLAIGGEPVSAAAHATGVPAGFDLAAFSLAERRPIHEVSGQPGVRQLVLEAVYKPQDSGVGTIWFRFRMSGGAKEVVEAVSADGVSATIWQHEERGDLLVVAQAARPKGRPHVKVTMVGGRTYSFAVRGPSMADLVTWLVRSKE